MKFEKAPQNLIDLLARLIPSNADIQHRKMFGYPAYFINGNMFVGLFGHSLFLRLDDAKRKSFLQMADAGVLEPMPGRPMKEYVVAPDKLLREERQLTAWIEESARYAGTLPKKEKKK